MLWMFFVGGLGDGRCLREGDSQLQVSEFWTFFPYETLLKKKIKDIFHCSLFLSYAHYIFRFAIRKIMLLEFR